MRVHVSVVACSLLLAGCGGPDAEGRATGAVFDRDQTCGLRVELAGGLAASLTGADTECACVIPIGPDGINTTFLPLAGALGHFQLDAGAIHKGAVGPGFAAEVRLIAKDGGGAWDALDCTIDLEEHAFLRQGELGDHYRAVGSGRCAAPASSDRGGDPVTIGAFDFVTTVSWVGD